MNVQMNARMNECTDARMNECTDARMNGCMDECTDRRMKMLIGSIKETENGYAGDMVRAIL